MKALSNHDVTGSLIGIETYNAAGIDRMSNHYAHILGEHLEIAKVGSKFPCQYIYPPYEYSIVRRLICK